MSSPTSQPYRLTLNGAATVSNARELAKTAFKAWDALDLVDDAMIIVSELATNALKHGKTKSPHVELHRSTSGALIRVWDPNPIPPIPRDSTTVDTDGRGLSLVAAYARSWGNYPCSRGGKWVYAVLAFP